MVGGLKKGRFALAWSGLTSVRMDQVGLGPVSDRSVSSEDGDADLDFLGYYCIMHWEWLAAMSWLNWAWEFACEGVWVPRVGISLDGWIWQGTYIGSLRSAGRWLLAFGACTVAGCIMG